MEHTPTLSLSLLVEEPVASPKRPQSPPHPQPQLGPPPTGVSQLSPELIEAIATTVAIALAGQIPPVTTVPVPPTVPTVPTVPPVPTSSSSVVSSVAKRLKEARQLGCMPFRGDFDATTVKNWIQMMFEAFTDMEIVDEMKLRLTVRFLEGRARTW